MDVLQPRCFASQGFPWFALSQRVSREYREEIYQKILDKNVTSITQDRCRSFPRSTALCIVGNLAVIVRKRGRPAAGDLFRAPSCRVLKFFTAPRPPVVPARIVAPLHGPARGHTRTMMIDEEKRTYSSVRSDRRASAGNCPHLIMKERNVFRGRGKGIVIMRQCKRISPI